MNQTKDGMNYFLTTLLAMMTTAMAVAQPTERVLTMEEAVLGVGLQVENRQVVWRPSSEVYTVVDGSTIYDVDLRTGEQQVLTTLDRINAVLGTSIKRMPPYTLTGKGTMRFQVGRELVGIDPKADTIVHRYPFPEGVNAARYADEGRFLYARANNLWWSDRAGKEYAITEESDPAIVSGQVVSRNEFGIMSGVFPAPDLMQVAFYQKDESAVTQFPLLDIQSRTGTLREIRYPMAGMASERVRLGIYHYETRQTVWVDVDDFTEERYLCGVTWSPDSKLIYIQVLDRKQQNVHLNAYSAADGKKVRTVLTEHSDKYVEPVDGIHFLKGDPAHFIYTTSNRDGYRNLYRCSVEGEVERLTKVDADVEWAGQYGRYLFYYSAEVSPVERHLFRIDTKTGKTARMTHAAGWHNCIISPDGTHFIDNYSSLDVPRIITLNDSKGRVKRTILTAADPSKELNYGVIELGSIKSADGQYDNYYRLIKPHDFDPTKKYPVILYVYGGPHSQMVTNTFQAQLRRWEMLMAQRGYVVLVMDNRGTSNRGLNYEQATHRNLGKCEMADQVKAVEWLLENEWADRERVGVHGWSYGGFMTISLLTNYPDLFKVGVAGGPVIDWKWYEVMYGERYMSSPEDNPEGYAATSLIPMAEKLQGKLLICQGAVDPVVVWQHSLSFVRACVVAGVQVDYFPYPTHEHNVMGKDRVHLMQKVTDYFELHL